MPDEELNEILRSEQDRITIQPAPDIAPNAWRAHCEGCSRSFVVYVPQDFWILCPSCSNARKPTVEEK